MLLGDVPLIQPETIERLRDAAGDGMALLTTVLRNPTGYGRILRQRGRIVAIVEQKDATEGKSRFVKLIRASCFSRRRVFRGGSLN